MKFMSAIKELLENKETILIYPEQSLWLNYKKPKPLKPGAFDLASRYGCPIVPIYLELNEYKKKDKINPGFYLERYTVHILKPIYPIEGISRKENSNIMLEKTFIEMKEEYERIYSNNIKY